MPTRFAGAQRWAQPTLLNGRQKTFSKQDRPRSDIAEMPVDERAKIKVLPASLEDALDALKGDYAFLLKGGVFTEDSIDAWIKYKLEKELEPLRGRPHPYEFELYSDI